MKISSENRCRILVSDDYAAFKHNTKRLSRARLNLLIEEMTIKNLSKDLPIIVDENFNILDGKYRFEANKKLGEKIYYKCAEVGTYLDFMKAANLQYKPTLKDFAIHHSDKLSYRKLLDCANKIPFGFKEYLYEICDISTKSRSNMKKFKDGTFDFTIQMEYKSKEVIKIAEYVFEKISDSIIIDNIAAILDACDYNLKGFVDIIDHDRTLVLKYVELLEAGFPFESIYNNYGRRGGADIVFSNLILELCGQSDIYKIDSWYDEIVEEESYQWRGESFSEPSHHRFPASKKLNEIYDNVYSAV